MNTGRNVTSPTTNGWVEDAHYSNCFLWSCTELTFFRGWWWVPTAPTNLVGQTIFLFIGEEDYWETQIVQPVLQWGASCAGGGNYWSIASWYVWGSGCAASAHTSLHAVNSWDEVWGSISLQSNGNWQITVADYTTGYVGGSLTVNANQMYNAFVTLEAYGVTNCNQYPAVGVTHFFYLYVAGGTPGWRAEYPNKDCSADSVAASGSSDVWLYY